MYIFRHVVDELLFGSIPILRLYSTLLGYLWTMAQGDGQVLSQYQKSAIEPKKGVNVLVEIFTFAILTISLDYELFLMLVLSIESLFLRRNVLSHESSFKKKPTQVYKKDTKVQKELIVTQSISDKYSEIGCHNIYYFLFFLLLLLFSSDFSGFFLSLMATCLQNSSLPFRKNNASQAFSAIPSSTSSTSSPGFGPMPRDNPLRYCLSSFSLSDDKYFLAFCAHLFSTVSRFFCLSDIFLRRSSSSLCLAASLKNDNTVTQI